jgi:DUF4097 and DUF4098 domain-containing protein YvlB
MKPFEAKISEDWSLPLEGAAGLRVRTADSAIRVVGSETDEIQIHATKTARANTESAARAFLDEMKVERRRDGDLWIIEAVWPQPRPRDVEGAGISLEIRVPRGLSLEASSSNGSVEASGVARALLRTSNGSITARDVEESLQLHTSNGAVRVERCAGPVEAKTENGRVEIRRAQGSVTARTSNGAIQVEECAGPVEAKTENARVEVAQSPGAITTHTSNGAIRIEDCPGPIEARTSSGSITIRRARHAIHARTSDGRIEAELDQAEGPVEAELLTCNASIDLTLPHRISARLVADTCNARITVEPSTHANITGGPTHLETVLGTGEGSVRLRSSNGAIRIRLTG